MRDISLHVLDIVNNSLEAGADLIEVIIDEGIDNDELRVRINDNGRGMDEEFVKKAVTPFFTSRKTRKVGLGLPLLKAACERCGGKFDIQSKPGKGTKIDASFGYHNIDRPPMGNMADTILSLVILNPAVDFIYQHSFNGKMFGMDTRELKNALNEVPLNSPEVAGWLRDYLTEGISSIRATSSL